MKKMNLILILFKLTLCAGAQILFTNDCCAFHFNSAPAGDVCYDAGAMWSPMCATATPCDGTMFFPADYQTAGGGIQYFYVYTDPSTYYEWTFDSSVVAIPVGQKLVLVASQVIAGLSEPFYFSPLNASATTNYVVNGTNYVIIVDTNGVPETSQWKLMADAAVSLSAGLSLGATFLVFFVTFRILNKPLFKPDGN